MLHLLAGPPWHGELHPQTIIPNKDASSFILTSLTWWATPANPLSLTKISFFKSLLSGILYYSNRKILNTENENLAWECCSDELDSIVVRSSGFICCKKRVEEFGILGQTHPHIQISSKLSRMWIWKRRLLRWIQTVETWGFRGQRSTRTWRLLWDIFWQKIQGVPTPCPVKLSEVEFKNSGLVSFMSTVKKNKKLGKNKI